MDYSKTSWKIRRSLMFIITFFCMTIIWVVVHGALDSEIAKTALTYSYWIIFAVMVIYVFGVITDEQISKLLSLKLGIKDQ